VNAIARHIGVKLENKDWDKIGYDIPLLVNLMPAGKYLGEAFHRAGGVPTVMRELHARKKIHGDAMTVNGRTMAQNLKKAVAADGDVIMTYDKPMLGQAGFAVMSGNLFDSAIMKTSVISDEFRSKYLERKGDRNAFEGTAIVFEGPEDYHHRINDPKLPIDGDSILFIRNAGPIGYPGAAEVVNMLPPDRLVKGGVLLLPCIGDGRQSGTSASPSILNASPEAAIGGGIALVKTGDKVRVDIGKRTANIMISAAELAKRKAAWKPNIVEAQTPWQELQRKFIGQLSSGACLDFAVNFQNIAESKGVPRHSH
jgi:dihydroxy-acid dehydratase